MKKLFSPGILLPTLFLSLSSCKKNKTDNAATLRKDIHISTNTTLGKYLSNKQGLTYMFPNWADGVSLYTGGCETVWPPFIVDLTTAKLDAGLAASDFGTIPIADGKKQVSNKGWPLYTYTPSIIDGYGIPTNIAEAAGAARGDGFGGHWVWVSIYYI
ncbi:MAG: hypothetical protein ABIN89_10120 [Chitinophagaceae bacterium]